MKHDDTLRVVGALLIVGATMAAVAGLAIGYVLNLVAIAQWTDGPGMLALRCIGAFIAPLGGILGWIG